MYVIVLCIFILKLQSSVSQYPEHMDFQKVGEVIFNNEKFNILKPTTHIISDYFKQFMLRTSDSSFPTKRLFIDDNGLRHFWTGFGKKSQSLRKTDEIDTSLIVNTENAYENKAESKEKATVGNKNVTTAARTTTTNKNDNDSNPNDKHSNEVSENQEDHTENKDSVEKYSEEEDTGSTTMKSLLSKKKRMFRSGNVMEILRNDKKDDKSKADPAKKDSTKKAESEKKASSDTGKKEKTKKDDSKKDSDSGKVVAKTTFFCPFFGVITMSAFID